MSELMSGVDGPVKDKLLEIEYDIDYLRDQKENIIKLRSWLN